MNRDLMLAVLSMDSYSNDRQNIGTATLLPSILPNDAGFYAKAYTYNGETIISYRGTDGGWAAANDILNGWGGGAGYAPTQASLAAEFYRAVIGANASPYAGNVTFTGHSLGGGLAGLMAGLYGKDAVVFDNMAYSGAINDVYSNAIRPYNMDLQTGLVIPGEENPFHQRALDDFYPNTTPNVPNTSGISGYQLSGQILQTLGQSTGAVIGQGVNWGEGAVDLHSQALLVLNMYADQTSDLDDAWKDVAKYLGPELFEQGAVTDIAYSVVSEGVRPKGDAAAHSMFNDAADIANFVATEGSSLFKYTYDTPAYELAAIAVQFAKRQADNAVTGTSMDDKGSGIFHETDAGLYISLDATDSAWGEAPTITGWETLKSSLEYLLQRESGEALSEGALSVMDKVDFALFSAGGTVDLDLQSSNPMLVAGQIENPVTAAGLVFGTDDVDVIKGGGGDDFLIGGGGADTLIGGDGKDALFGGEGADILVSGTLAGNGTGEVTFEEETVVGGANSDYIVLSNEGVKKVVISGGDPEDRLMVHADKIGFEGTRGGEGYQMFTLLGATFTQVPFIRLGEHPSATDFLNWNIGEDDLGVYRLYETYVSDIEAVPGDTYHDWYVNGGWTQWEYGLAERSMEGGISYRHYESQNLLVIQIVAGEMLEFEIHIEDYHPGDYGIQLVGPLITHALYELNDTLGPHGLSYEIAELAPDKMQTYQNFYRDVLSKSDEISLSEEGAIAQRSLAPTESTPDVRVVFTGEDSVDKLSGNNVAETFHGQGGNDTISASGGDDRVFGGDGADRLIGGQGADTLDGGAGVDTADYRTSDAAVQVSLLAQSGTGGDAEGDTLVFIENLAGSNFGDVLTGDDAVNRLQGFNGNDQLLGGGGNDRLLGGLGADVINGGDGVDTADYSTSLAAVQVNLKLNVGQGAEAAGDSFLAIENLSGSDFGDTLTGDDLNNRLSGVDGNDILSGLGGIDYLVGGSGNDVMTGGAGADVFVFNLGSGRDTITDFWAGTGRTDRIQFVDGQLGTFAGVLAHTANTSAGVVITLSADDSLTLSGLQISQLRADDFLFA
jgi:Ca2+-binding RTX toxin-like protein